jgi:hypothetical protein
MKWDSGTGRRRKLTETDYPNLRHRASALLYPVSLQKESSISDAWLVSAQVWKKQRGEATMNSPIGATTDCPLGQQAFLGRRFPFASVINGNGYFYIDQMTNSGAENVIGLRGPFPRAQW